jgi:hypothetical protein
MYELIELHWLVMYAIAIFLIGAIFTSWTLTILPRIEKSHSGETRRNLQSGPQRRCNDYDISQEQRSNGSEPGFPRWIGPAELKVAETLAKLPISSFTRRVRHDPAT